MPMKKLIGPIRQVLTLDQLPLKGALRDEQLEILSQAGILVEGAHIVKVGSWEELKQAFPEAEIHELDGDYVALPGMVDCHTHLCFGGSRARDFALRNAGKTYLEIAAAGGGIWDTVSQTRSLDQETLAGLTAKHANRLLSEGVTTIEVKSGYAKNFLIPQKKAICFTPTNFKIFEEKKHEFEQENPKNVSAASKIKDKIEGKDILIIQNASDDGRLYGSVNSSLIATKLNEIAGEKAILRNQIFLSKSIKEIGVYNAVIQLHSDVSCAVRLIVTRSESEVEALLKAAAHAKGKNKSSDAEDAPAQNAEVVSEEVTAEKPKRTRKKKEDAAEAAE